MRVAGVDYIHDNGQVSKETKMLEELPSCILTSFRFVAGLRVKEDSEPSVTLFVTEGERSESGESTKTNNSQQKETTKK